VSEFTDSLKGLLAAFSQEKRRLQKQSQACL